MKWRTSLLALLCLALGPAARACGPSFPNQILIDPDRRALEAPVSTFALELQRLALPAAAHRSVLSGMSPGNATLNADCAELQAALDTHGMRGRDAEQVLAKHRALRSVLAAHAAAIERWKADVSCFWVNPKPARPPLPAVEIPAGLPPEFNEYTAGAVAYTEGRLAAARARWEAVLALPVGERRYRSTWAAFMLGKSWSEEDPARAIEWFARVRRLADEGFADSLGLAAESIGWEGRAELNRHNAEAAIARYLEHLAAGDPTAIESVRRAAGALLQSDAAASKRAARNPPVQRAVTAYLASGCAADQNAAAQWLAAVEAAGVSDVADADRLAAIAYRSGDFDTAQRWLAKAGLRAPLANWLRAKMLLRDGKIEEAARILSQVVRAFPADNAWKALREDRPCDPWLSFPDKPSGEMGALLLARQQYVEALDVLLRGGYWLDGAYVAESVLSADELLAYVNRCWSAQPIARDDGNYREALDARHAPGKIRHLLARRLTRLGRYAEARDYFPEEWRAGFDRFVEGLRKGKDAQFPATERAAALWVAARIARRDGLALMGTELDPDWAAVQGQYDPEELAVDSARAAVTNATLSATPDERQRIRQHARELAFAKRFHYRYVAAELAWQAAELMTDNTPAKAAVLCEAGSWLKQRDPLAADRFYKALVRHCGKTDLGREAARLNWFPATTKP